MTKVSDERLNELYSQVEHVRLGMRIGKVDITDATKNLLDMLDGMEAALRAHNSDSVEPVAWIIEEKSFGWKERIVTDHPEEGSRIRNIRPLYLASPPAKEVEKMEEDERETDWKSLGVDVVEYRLKGKGRHKIEITDEMVERAMDAMSEALRSPPDDRMSYQEVGIRAALHSALTNRTPDDE